MPVVGMGEGVTVSVTEGVLIPVVGRGDREWVSLFEPVA